MTHERDLERLLDSWFADGPLVVSDRVIDGVEARIVRQPQRPAWRLRSWRSPTMSTQLRIAVLAGALLIAALAGGILVLGGGGRSSSPAPSPAPSTTPEPTPIALVNASALPAGRYSTPLNAGRLAFTMPTGWSVADLSVHDFTLHLDAGPKDDTVKVFTDMRRASKDASCPEEPQAGVGATNDLLAADLSTDPQLAVTGGGRVALGFPGLSGQFVDVALAANATRTCPFSDGKVTVPLIVDTIPGQGAFWGIGPNEKIRLVLLDALGGHNVVVAIDSASGTSFDALTAAAMPIVESFAFDAAAGTAEATPGATPSASFLILQPGASSQKPGRYRTGVEAGWVTYDLPSGWTSPLVGPLDFVLHRDAGPSDDVVRVFFDMRRAAKDAACTEAPEPGVGTTAAALTDDIAADREVVVRSRSSITTEGLAGFVLDVELAPGVSRTCPFQPDLPGIPLIVDDVAGQGPFWGVSRAERLRLVILDAPSGHNVVVVIDSIHGTSFDALAAAAMPLVESLTFEPR